MAARSMIELSGEFIGMQKEMEDLDSRADALECNASSSPADERAAMLAEASELRELSSATWKKSYWYDVMVRPMAEAVADELRADGVSRVEVSGPLGLRGENYLAFMDADGNEKYVLCVSAGHLMSGELLYDTGEWTGEWTGDFAKGTIGSMNGMNNATATLPGTFHEIAEIVRARPVSRD